MTDAPVVIFSAGCLVGGALVLGCITFAVMWAGFFAAGSKDD